MLIPLTANAESPEVIIWTASEALPVKAKTRALSTMPPAFQNTAIPFIRQRDKFIGKFAFAAAYFPQWI